MRSVLFAVVLVGCATPDGPRIPERAMWTRELGADSILEPYVWPFGDGLAIKHGTDLLRLDVDGVEGSSIALGPSLSDYAISRDGAELVTFQSTTLSIAAIDAATGAKTQTNWEIAGDCSFGHPSGSTRRGNRIAIHLVCGETRTVIGQLGDVVPVTTTPAIPSEDDGAFVFAPDGSLVVGGTNGYYRVAPTGARGALVPLPDVFALAVTDTGELVVSTRTEIVVVDTSDQVRWRMPIPTLPLAVTATTEPQVIVASGTVEDDTTTITWHSIVDGDELHRETVPTHDVIVVTNRDVYVRAFDYLIALAGSW